MFQPGHFAIKALTTQHPEQRLLQASVTSDKLLLWHVHAAGDQLIRPGVLVHVHCSRQRRGINMCAGCIRGFLVKDSYL